MENRRQNRLIFVGPGPKSQGGISVVIENLRRSSLGGRYNCLHFGTCTESSSILVKASYSAWRYVVFAAMLLWSRPSLISVHSAVGVSFYRKLIYMMISRALGFSTVWHVHPSVFYEFYTEGGLIRKFWIHLAGRLNSKIIFLTQDMVEKFSEVWPGKPLVAIPNPVDTKIYWDGPRSSMKGNYNILYMGWIVQSKGVYDIVHVIPDVIKQFPKANFFFAGHKEIEKLSRLITKMGLNENAHVLGWVEGEEKLRILKASRMLLLPTYTEGIPNVMLEAMASGLPLITTPVGGIPSVFVEGENGYYVTPGNREDLEARILQLMEDDTDCERISRLTRQRVKEKYDLEVIAQKLEAVYYEFLHSNGSDGKTALG